MKSTTSFSTLKLASSENLKSTFVEGERSSSRSALYGRQWLGGIIGSYGAMVEDRLATGYEPYLLSFMFHHLGGSPSTVAKLMAAAIEDTYSRVVGRVIRCPNSAYNVANPLLWLACPDYPVGKTAKISLRDAVVNDGRHVHAIVLVPPFTRLKRPFDVFVALNQPLFVRGSIARVHALHISETPTVAVAYVLKQLSRHRVGPDELIVLPRSRHELPDLKRHPNGGKAGQVRRAAPV